MPKHAASKPSGAPSDPDRIPDAGGSAADERDERIGLTEAFAPCRPPSRRARCVPAASCRRPRRRPSASPRRSPRWIPRLRLRAARAHAGGFSYTRRHRRRVPRRLRQPRAPSPRRPVLLDDDVHPWRPRAPRRARHGKEERMAKTGRDPRLPAQVAPHAPRAHRGGRAAGPADRRPWATSPGKPRHRGKPDAGRRSRRSSSRMRGGGRPPSSTTTTKDAATQAAKKTEAPEPRRRCWGSRQDQAVEPRCSPGRPGHQPRRDVNEEGNPIKTDVPRWPSPSEPADNAHRHAHGLPGPRRGGQAVVQAGLLRLRRRARLRRRSSFAGSRQERARRGEDAARRPASPVAGGRGACCPRTRRPTPPTPPTARPSSRRSCSFSGTVDTERRAPRVVRRAVRRLHHREHHRQPGRHHPHHLRVRQRLGNRPLIIGFGFFAGQAPRACRSIAAFPRLGGRHGAPALRSARGRGRRSAVPRARNGSPRIPSGTAPCKPAIARRRPPASPCSSGHGNGIEENDRYFHP